MNPMQQQRWPAARPLPTRRKPHPHTNNIKTPSAMGPRALRWNVAVPSVDADSPESLRCFLVYSSFVRWYPWCLSAWRSARELGIGLSGQGLRSAAQTLDPSIPQDQQLVHGIQDRGSLRNDDNGDALLLGSQKSIGQRLFTRQNRGSNSAHRERPGRDPQKRPVPMQFSAFDLRIAARRCVPRRSRSRSAIG